MANEFVVGINPLLEKVGLPVLIAFITYLLLNRLDEWKKRKNDSILGTVILDALIEELKTGLDIMKNTLNSEDYMDPRNPPRASWMGMHTVPDDVLLRIIATTKKIKPDGFHPKDIRIHCKNYFMHMLANWDKAQTTEIFTPQALIKMNYSRYAEVTNSILVMLELARETLQSNAQKAIPK